MAFLQRWRRYLPERSQVIILIGVVAVLAAAVAFVNLALAKAAALRDLRAVQSQIATLEDQQQRLKYALADAQQGYNIEPKAREYFNLARKSEKTVVLQPAAPGTEPGTGAQQSGTAEGAGEPDSAGEGTFWREWWERLTKP